MAASIELLFTLVYIVLALCLVMPPSEFIAAGLTVQNLLAGTLGSEDLSFVYHHIKRTTATVIVHSFIPLCYYVGLGLFASGNDRVYYKPWLMSRGWQTYLAFSFLVPVAVSLLAYYWSRNKWSNHPIARTLEHLAPSGSSWFAIASSVNVEFRRIDKFTTGQPGRRIYITDSWVMKTTAYFVHVAHQSDIHLTLTSAEQHDLSHESNVGAQYLNIDVVSANNKVKPFTIRLNATDYRDLQDKLQTRVRNVRNVVIQQSLSDRFLEAFRQEVNHNEVYAYRDDAELEHCIGCMQTMSNVKLQKHCDNLSDGDCVQCYCRPMWCLECLGKWFASRQNQNQPETWMASRSPCPTCRAKFCLLDVCKIV